LTGGMSAGMVRSNRRKRQRLGSVLVTIKNITKDSMYEAVAPDDFVSMLNLDRYAARSPAFDKIIAATHDHFWDPLDKRYIDFSEPFDMENEPIIPEELVGALQTKYVSDALSDRKTRVRFINQSALRSFSSILHGEQGALNLSASLCHVLYDQGAQEYAANQTREEARHVTAFAQYIKARWGRPVACSPVLQSLLVEIIQKLNDPLGRKLMQLVMTDEAFHHKFGKIWADRTVPKLTEEEHTIVEDWAAHCFQTLLFNLVAPSEQQDLYAEFGLDPMRVIAEFQEIATDEARREDMKEATNIFRVLI
jgi:hypothetical protein